jgi:hypothetical protein
VIRSHNTRKVCLENEELNERIMLDVAQSVRMKRKTKLYGSGVLVACIVVTIVGYFALWADRGFTVYDDRFKILDYVISRGTTHTIYRGNQTAGRIRAMLKNRLGLKFINLPPAAMTQGPKNLESLVFLMNYSGNFPLDELDDLTVVLTNDKNIYKELPGGNLFVQSEQIFSGCYFLPALPASEDSFRIELRLTSADAPIASWRLGKLYRNNQRIMPNP